ncbi:MAG: rhodanese-like domain-containing protein [Halodesulfurarchaeum sp.]
MLLTAEVLGHVSELYLLDGGTASGARPEYPNRPYRPRQSPPMQTSRASRSSVARQSQNGLDDDRTVLVDTRSVAEYDAAHMPGAVRVRWEVSTRGGMDVSSPIQHAFCTRTSQLSVSSEGSFAPGSSTCA